MKNILQKMKDFQITKKLFRLTLFWLIIDFLIFLYDGGIGISAFFGGVFFYFPLVLLLILFDRFILKNKGYQFFAIIAFLGVFAFILYLLVQSYNNSVFFLP